MAADNLRSAIGLIIHEYCEGDEPDARVYADRIIRLVYAELREPTEAMDEAGGDRDRLGWDAAPGSVWQAMLDASPLRPQP
jgi:hypothetical protein